MADLERKTAVDTESAGIAADVAEAALAEIAARLRVQLAAPKAESLTEVAAAHVALRALPASVVSALRVDCLLDVAQFFYISGQTLLGLEPAANAVHFARQYGDRGLLRKALTFQGILLADSGNLPAAIECYAEALELILALGDRIREAPVWNNLGVALLYGAQYAESIQCFDRALDLAKDEDELSGVRQQALTNVALASLYAEEFARGLRAARLSVEQEKEPTSANQLLTRVLAETNYARLLLEVDNLDRARERCEIAKQYAAKSCSQKAEHSAEIAEGLYEVYAGLVDVGISRLQRALDRARIMKSSLRDALIALVKAYDIAGKPQLALIHLRELLHHTKRSQIESALQHQRLHLERLEQSAGRSEESEPLGVAEPAAPLGDAKRERMKAQLALLHRQAITAELSEDPSGEHVYRVGKLAALLAADYGCDDDTCFMIEMSARLHDIGKLGIPVAILAKRGRINQDQMSLARTHANIGAELLSQSGLPQIQMAVDIARHHHEWWDGSGYPDGIAGKAIPDAARITALADVFDVLVHARPYKEAWPVARALEEIQRLKGTHFDPELADLLVALVRRLQREVGDLDEYLGAEARESPFIRARRKIADALRQANGQRPGTLS
ncbi:HD domain-containing protein [Betaproteobacteria bacterium PRO7]|jgi:response regulator RpfG family c-di-GMP phosphodiesterase|nr:HD domain-containing protein [Betaproteobacteria bacterium PRO7]